MKFVLMPDALSASSFRSVLAEKNTLGVKVGTFSSLLESLAILWILPELSDEFESLVKTNALKLAAKSDNDVFWSKSIVVDETATLSEISSSLKLLLVALPLDEKLVHLHNPKTRIENYYNDLINLHMAMEHVRQLEQMQASQWLSVVDSVAIEPLELIYLSDLFSFEPWQLQLIKKLEENSSRTNADEISNTHQLLIDFVETNNERSPDVKHLSQSLFELPNIKKSKETDRNEIDNIHWLACRDSLQEVEVVVGMVQKALELGINLNEMAIVVPHQSGYLKTLPAVLNRAGILTSNHHSYTSAFQWDLQLVKDLLVFYEQKESEGSIVSPMSLAAILTNPLMPWSKSKGQTYAEQCFRGKLEEKLKEVKSKDTENSDDNASLISQIVQSKELWNNWLNAIVEKLNYPKDARLGSLKNMKLIINSLMESSSSYIYPKESTSQTNAIVLTEQLQRLIKEIEPEDIELELEKSGTVLNGLLVITENEWLLKSVKHLFVVGFNQGCYTPASNAKNVFGDANLQSLENKLKLNFDSSERRQNRFQKRMKMLLSKTEKSVTFLLSEQSLSGDKIHPSETLLDMALCFQNIDEVNPDKLVESLAGCSVNYLENILPFFKRLSSQSASQSASQSVNATSSRLKNQPSNVEPQDLSFDFDLLKLHRDKEGNQRTESPSSLEKMMISPLAWLLSRQGLEPKSWAVQELSVALKGSIAHKVFECHFDKRSLLNVDAYDTLYIEALKSDAPFMLMPQWRLERTQLKHEIKKSLLPFINWCEQEGWSVTATEMELTGDLWGLAMRGFVDSILSKGNESLILDYKKSSSKKRVQRLESGYDLQTVIYRELFEQNNDVNKSDIHSGYYTLNDSALVLDTYAETSVEGIERVKLDVEIKQQSIEAIQLIKQRIKQLKKGNVELNQEGDTELWDSLGINATYSIDEAPLVGHFLKAAEESNDE